MSILLDAGPSLNFLAVGQERILIEAAQSHGLQLAAPERVDREVEGKSKDPRFNRTPVLGTWKKLKASSRLTILDDSLQTSQFTAAVTRISGVPASQRVRTPRDLGEIMVLAHASVYVQRGHHVFVLMDERDGRARAAKERDWLTGQNAAGTLILWSTRQVLKHAAQQPGWIKGGLGWEAVYKQMCTFDDGLSPL